MNNRIVDYIERIRDELFSHNQFIFDHPETAFKEFRTSEHLCNWAIEKGFSVVKGQGLLETGFVASRVFGNGGKCVGFVAEYDALEGLGHGCGHNLIATMSFGAAFALSEIAEEDALELEIRIIGTPAEESGGGKIHMLQSGFFDGVDFAMMIHPSNRTMVEDFSFANQIMKYQFFGKSAHASAAPWEGANAVEGMLQALNLINGLRLQMKDYSRVNPLIVSSGKSNNVVPDYAEMELNIRSADNDYLNCLIEDVNRCVLKGSEAYKLDLNIETTSLRYEAVMNNPVLEEVMAKYFEALGETVLSHPRNRGVGSTDMGNVTQRLPAIHGHLRLNGTVKTHTVAFRDATINEDGRRTIVTGAKVMAMTAFEVITDEEKFNAMKKAFDVRGGEE
ncbi:MAG: hypothetical protein AVO33_00295 [delta proteobacterium ML8_F1]|nr:MAG: hypothetical protein AVO33_00295 [delta proteobacterium ML8_F1]